MTSYWVKNDGANLTKFQFIRLLLLFVFPGEFVVNLQNALLDNAMIWYELESPNHSKASKSPRSSISETGKGGLRNQNIRSVSGINYRDILRVGTILKGNIRYCLLNYRGTRTRRIFASRSCLHGELAARI